MSTRSSRSRGRAPASEPEPKSAAVAKKKAPAKKASKRGRAEVRMTGIPANVLPNRLPS